MLDYLLEWKVCCRPPIGSSTLQHAAQHGCPNSEQKGSVPEKSPIVSFASRAMGSMNQVMATSKFPCYVDAGTHHQDREPQCFRLHASFL